MQYTIQQTVSDADVVYSAKGEVAPAYSADIQLAFCGVKSVLRVAGDEVYSLFFDREQPLSTSIKYGVPRSLYPLNIYKSGIRVGSVKFKRCNGLFGLTYLLMLEKSVFRIKVYGGNRGKATMFVRENGRLAARIEREKSKYDDKSIYNVWVNDMDFLPKPTIDEAVPVDVDTYSIFPEVAFVCDACAAFVIYYDTAMFKPFGEFEFARKKPLKRGMRAPRALKKQNSEYAKITNPPTPEQLRAELERELAERAAAERAEQERAQREEAKRLADEAARAEKQAKAAEKAEARRVAEEKLRAKRAEDQRIAAEKAEAAGRAKENARLEKLESDEERSRIAAELAKENMLGLENDDSKK